MTRIPMEDSTIKGRHPMSIKTPVATMPLKLSYLAIKRALNDPRKVVECDTPMLGKSFWRRICAVRFHDGTNWQGLCVQEHGGLGRWYSPMAARWRVLQAVESALAKAEAQQ